MPHRTPRTPKYRHYKPKNLAVVRIDGRDHYLGEFGSEASRERYDRLIAEWLSNHRTLAPHQKPGTAPGHSSANHASVAEVILAYWQFAQTYYVKNGEPSGHLHTVRKALRMLRTLYARTPAADFGPLALRALQQKMIDDGNARSYISCVCGAIRRVFKWAASQELVPVTVYQALATVPGLKRGRTSARETDPIGPVDDRVVDATLEHLDPILADMVRFQRLTAARPSEVCLLQPEDLDRSGEVWEYRPGAHKTEHHGRGRLILVGPRAQAVLTPYLLRPANAYCFSPREAVEKRHAERRTARRSPITPSQARRRRKTKPKRAPGPRYTPASYRQAIHRACDRARLQRWSPNQLRHSAGTEIRRKFGLEAAQVVLGHARADVTQLYAERDTELARRTMQQVG